MGEVLEVVDETTQRSRALKVMLPGAVDHPELRARFAQEAYITGGIESDHIVQVSDAGVDADSGMPFLVMDLLRGEELGDLSKRRGPLPPAEVVLYLQQIALALDKTHAAGIIHRDLKLENLFLTKRDDGSPCVKILDFGVAKLAVQHSLDGRTAIVGTPLYMAPEQIRGDGHVDPRADLYALGHVAYTLLTGGAYWMIEAMEARNSVFVLFQRILAGMPEPPSARAARQGATLLPAVDAWFARAMALEANDRFERATTAIALLEEALRTSAPPPPPTSPTPPRDARLPQRRQRRGGSDPVPKGADALAPAAQTVAQRRGGSDKPPPDEPLDKAGQVAGLLVIRAADHPLLVGRLLRLIYNPTYLGPDEDSGVALGYVPAGDMLARFARRAGRWFFQSGGSHDILEGKRVIGEVPLKGDDHLWIQSRIRSIAFKFIDNGDELRHHEEQYKVASFDALTQAHNRRYLKRALQGEYRRACEAGRDLSILMLDIKPVQGVTRALPEREADLLLKQLARIVRSHMPEGGLLARYSGDTFALLLPGLRPAEAVALATKLSQETREGLSRFPQAVRVKIRFGTASRLPSDKHEHDLLARAERTLLASDP